MERASRITFSSWLSVLLPAVPLLGACSTNGSQLAVCHGQQLMITFATGVNVTDRTFNAGLSHAAGIRLDYMRQLFDDHHLYCAVYEGPPVELDAVLERLRGRADIRAVEIDRMKRAQP